MKIFSDIPFVCENTELIAKKCSFFLRKKYYITKNLEINQEDDFLKKKSQIGLLSRLNTS